MCSKLLAIGLQGTLALLEPLLNTFSNASTVRPTLENVFSRGYAPTTPLTGFPSVGVTDSRFFAPLGTIARPPHVCRLFFVCVFVRGRPNCLVSLFWELENDSRITVIVMLVIHFMSLFGSSIQRGKDLDHCRAKTSWLGPLGQDIGFVLATHGNKEFL